MALLLSSGTKSYYLVTAPDLLLLLLHETELDFELVHINGNLEGADMATCSLEFDLTHGQFPKTCTKIKGDNTLVVDRKQKIRYSKQLTAHSIPWTDSGVELIFECTGAF